MKASAQPRSPVAVLERNQVPANRGNGAPSLPPAKFVPKISQKPFAKPPVKTPVEEKEAIETAAALRVPFGRGPKDKAFRQERQEKEKTRRDKRGRR
jgi:hypothetical protein